MKKLLFNIFALCLIGILPFACSKEETQSNGIPMEISLSLTGDISVEQEPLTKVSTDDLYGINVYYDKNKDGTIDDVYGYGLFDDVSKMTITLISGYKYRFECALVKDGKNKLYKSNINEYKLPFSLDQWGNEMVLLQNKFLTGVESAMPYITNGAATMVGSTSKQDIPQLDRYFGETTNYEPIENGKVIIDLKRCSFGVKYIITGLKGGRLEGGLIVGDDEFHKIDTRTNIEGDVCIYSFPNQVDCYEDEEVYSINADMNMYYYSDRGLNGYWDRFLLDKTILLKRNKLTIISINVNPDLSSATMQFSFEEMSNDENEINLGINGNGLIDNVVVPQ